MTSRRSFCGAFAVTMLVLPQVGGTQQAGRVYRIGFLGVASATASVTQRRIEAFRTGMRALGYVEGSNVIIEFRWAEGDANRLAELAGDLIRLRVDLLVTQGSTSTRIAKAATSTIPIVMLAVGDAVGAGLVGSLARPGGNVTGSTFLSQQIYAKQLELLKEAIPSVARVAVLMNPDNPANRPVLESLEAVAHGLKVVLMEIDARGPSEYDGAFRAMGQQRADALVVSADAILTTNARVIAGLAVKHRLPATSAWSDFTESGGLLGYGPNIYDLYGRAAPRFVDQILRGSRPAELSFFSPTCPLQRAMMEARLPLTEWLFASTPDEFMRRLGNLPLAHQPGDRWLYHMGCEILGVLIARASGQSLGSFLRERIFEPLGMKDTGFFVPEARLDRLPICYGTDLLSGQLGVLDEARGGQVARAPVFESGAGGLVSTIDDMAAFGQMMLNKGVYRGERILSRPSIELMIVDHLTPEQKAASPFFANFWDDRGWGFGLGVTTARSDLQNIGRFGWDGAFGTSWHVDPKEEMVGVLMTQRRPDKLDTPALTRDFWTSACQLIDD